MFNTFRNFPRNLCRMFVYLGRRGRRPLQKIMTYAMFCCRGGRPRPPVQITKRLPESADESRPLHRQRSLCLLEFYHDKIHRLRCGVSSSQKISGTTLIFRDPCFIKIKIIFPSPPRRWLPVATAYRRPSRQTRKARRNRGRRLFNKIILICPFCNFPQN